jgi:hypothetical protein
MFLNRMQCMGAGKRGDVQKPPFVTRTRHDWETERDENPNGPHVLYVISFRGIVAKL